MKAILHERYGPLEEVLQPKEVEKPIPNDSQVLVEVFAASVNIADLFRTSSRLGRFLGGGLRRPKDQRVGRDIAGRVESVGSKVARFRPGDKVFGSCVGGFAEYALAQADRLASIPVNVSFEDASAVPVAGITALQGLRDRGRIQAGQNVLVNGASGGVGTFAVQIAKSFGAQVTAVCSTKNQEQARSIGADQVIDYTNEDFTRNGRTYDIIFDIAGNRSISDYKRALKPNGICVVAGFSKNPLRRLMKVLLLGRLWPTGSKKILFMGIAKVNSEDLAFLAELLESGKVMPVIERRYSLGEAGQALRYLSQRHARGKIVILVKGTNGASVDSESRKPGVRP